MGRKFARFPRSRIWLTATVAALIPLAAVARPAAAATAVTCTYTVTATWTGGFAADVDITNNGPTINGWTLRWTFTTPTADIRSWSAVITEQAGNQATATNMIWDGTIATAHTASFGWSAAAVSTGVPTNLSINGNPC